jgi:hypothetical protein
VLPVPAPERLARAAAAVPETTASFAPLSAPVRPSPPPAIAAPVARAPVSLDGADNGCVPDALRAVLADMGSRFGKVTVVSTNELHTANHSAGSIREKLHLTCKAVDFRPERGRMNEIATYLRTRPEVAGINSYRNGVMHMDLNEGSRVAAGKRPPRQLVRRSTDTTDAENLETLPSPPAAASAFTPTTPDRDH